MKELICITCPRGCHLKVDENTLTVTGNTCEKGAEYGKNEVTNPVRVLTSIVKTCRGRVCSVKTDRPIPKDKIFDIMDTLKTVELKDSIAIGDIVVKDVCGTGANWIATKNMEG